MSKKCPECESKDIHITYYPSPADNLATCYGCGYFDLADRFPEQSVFDHITASPEVLAEKLVYRYDGNGTWRSFLLYGYEFLTKPEAINATVTRLREVCDE